MKNYLLTFALMAATTMTSWAAGPEGHWKGAIELSSGELEITVVLTRGDDEKWSGTIDIPSQNLRGFDLSSVSVEGGHVHFEMAGIPGEPTFDGEVAEFGDAISGTFRQGPQTLTFSLTRATGEAVKEEPDQVEGLPDEPVPGEGIVGEWLGALDVGPMNLRLALHVEEGEEGSLQAILDSVDQGAEIPIDSIALEGDTLRLAIASIAAGYRGTLSDNGSVVEGTWSQGGRDLPLTLHRLEERFVAKRPQHPEGPFPYTAEDVTFRSEAGNVRLAGTLVLPDGEGPFPAVAMVSGSGPQDRDESLMGHKPFLVIADHLARRGIASLRWDDRGAGNSGGDHMGSTVREFAADARAAVGFLAERPEVDDAAIGILGHSEGGLTGPIVASETEQLDFLVLLAPPGVPMRELLMRQTADVLRLQGLPEELIEGALAVHAEDLALVADPELSAGELEKELRALVEARREMYSPEVLEKFQMDDASTERDIRISTTPWFRSLVRQDPADYLREVKMPVLALFGQKDVQVAAEENAEAVRVALAAAENPDFEIHVLPGLNHLFQHAETGGLEEYAAIEETFAPEALERIADWIEARFGDEAEADPEKGETVKITKFFHLQP